MWRWRAAGQDCKERATCDRDIGGEITARAVRGALAAGRPPALLCPDDDAFAAGLAVEEDQAGAEPLEVISRDLQLRGIGVAVPG